MDTNLKDWPFWLLAIDVRPPIVPEQMNILHMCGYLTKPDEIDRESLYKELSEDQEFGMTDMIPKEDYILVEIEAEK